MYARLARNFIIAVCFIVLGTAFSFAQAVFTVGSSPATVTDIGYTEPAGAISFVVVSGVTANSPFVITYSAPITNSDPSEVVMRGDMIGASLEFDLENNAIRLNIPGGWSAGSQVTLSNILVAVAEGEVSKVTASVVSPDPAGNQIIAGQTELTVVARTVEPFSMDQSLLPPLSYEGGAVTAGATSFRILENYENSLVASAADKGRIRIIPFPSIPEGMQVTYAATAVSSETGAEFRTLSGIAETVPREDGSTDVIYQLTEGVNSILLTESFEFSASLSGNTTGSGIIQFQAELLPIGALIPSAEFPSTDVPRYAERLVPDEIDLISGSTVLSFPFRIETEDSYTGVALTNPANYRIRAILTANDAAGNIITGTGVTNPVEVDLPRRGQYAKLASEIFGPDFNASSSGTILVEARTTSLAGFYLTGDNSGPKLDGGVGDVRPILSWYLPAVFRQGSNPFNRIDIHNLGSSSATVNLQLIDQNGNQVATGTGTVAAGGLFSSDVSQIFGRNLNSFQGGYIKGESDLPLVVRDTFGNALESNVLEAQAANSLLTYSIPHFASGDSYTTELTIINTDPNNVADLKLTLLDNSSAQLADPVSVQINPKGQFAKTVASLFPNLGNALATGSIRVDVTPVNRGPFFSVPALSGSVRFANIDGSASAALPFIITPSTDFVYSQLAQTNGWFTGIAVLNTNTTPASMTLDVYSNDGTLTGTYSSQLQPGERFAKLVKQLVPESESQSGGYLRISSDLSLTSFSIFGSDDLRSLSAIPPQSVR